jgi:hypothetical protein
MGSNLCCSCAEEVPHTKLVYLPFKYNVPGVPEDKDKEAAALVCEECFSEANNPALYPVHEALINCNLIRVELPSKRFTPKDW